IIASAIGRTDKVVIVPNGVDLDRFEFMPKNSTGGRILFLGGMDYIPNLDSAEYFLTDIFPLIRSHLPEAKLSIVGRDLVKINKTRPSESIEFHENVADIVPYFRGSDVLVVPLRMGAGTRIKILEAMASGLPVVTTSKGCEGIEVKHGRHLLIADSP